MKVGLYEQLVRAGATRRDVLKGAASMAAIAAASGAGLGALTRPASAASELRAQILQDPRRRQGLSRPMPTSRRSASSASDATKANVKEGEFAGVELTFMGLNNQNLHNVLFRGFLKPWEAYTGAKISWIDLAQADYNARLQQSIATGTVDFDIIEMGAPFEGDVCGKGLTSEMPDWVKKQIDMDDLVDLSASRRSAPGTASSTASPSTATAHNFNYRTDVFADADLAKAWKDGGGDRRMGRAEDLAAGPGRDQVPQGQAVQGPGRLWLSRRAQGLGRFRLLLPRQPRHRLCQASRRQGLAVRRRHDEAARQQSGLGARDPGRDRRAAVRAGRPDQRRSEHHRLPAVPGRHRLDGHLVGRRRLQRQDQRLLGHRRRHRLLDPAGLGRCLQFQDRRMGQARQRPELCAELRLSRLGRLCHGPRRQRREEEEGGMVGRRPSRRQGPVDLDGDVSVGLPALPQLATSTFRNGWRPATTRPSSPRT